MIKHTGIAHKRCQPDKPRSIIGVNTTMMSMHTDDPTGALNLPVESALLKIRI